MSHARACSGSRPLTRKRRRRSRRFAELAGAIEHLQYAVFRRYNNQLTRAERSRLENTIDNALFKIDRFLLHAPPEKSGRSRMKCASCD